MSAKEIDIEHMENLLNQGFINNKDKSNVKQEFNSIDYNSQHTEIIKTLQNLINSELPLGYDDEDFADSLYIWLGSYKKSHSTEDFNILINKLHEKFDKERKTDNKIKILFKVLDNLKE